VTAGYYAFDQATLDPTEERADTEAVP
jgi:hypothetical protein